MTKEKVPFDPGYSPFAVNFPRDAHNFLEEISKLKQNHQKKFAFTNLENQIASITKLCSAFYLGCILWGSYLFWKYKNDEREIEGNPISSLSLEEKNKIKYNEEIDYTLSFLDKMEKSSKYYLNRSSRINPEYKKIFEVYKKFVELNDNFVNLKYTSEIKLPAEMRHFEKFEEQKLDELKQKIDMAIKSENPENILNIGFYN